MRLKSHDYFPSKPNAEYIYTNSNNTALKFSKYEDFNSDSKIQLRYKSNKSTIINLYEYDSFGVKQLLLKENYTTRENFLNSTLPSNNYLIKEPILVGTTWILPNGSTRSITSTNSVVKTPYKIFKSSLEITTISKNNYMSIDYYVENIGLVKTIYYSKSSGVLFSTLDDIIENTPYSQNVKLYFPDKNLDSIWYTNKTINFYTNDITIINFEKEFKNAPNGLLPVINSNTIINDIDFDESKSSISIDFSKDILKDTNSFYNTLSLQSICNTIKDYYNLKEITLTINKTIPLYPFYKNSSLTILNNILNNNHPLHEWRISQCKFPLTYIIKDNDTLIKIARDFDTNFDKLAKLNDIKNPNIINKGDIIQICSCGIYKIKPQDTIDEICNKFHLTYDEILKFNKVNNLSNLLPGQTLKLY